MHNRKMVFGLWFVLLVWGISLGEAAQTFQCTVQNQVVNGTSLSFDIYIRRLADPIDLGDSDFDLQFNIGNFSSLEASASANPAVTGYSMGAAIEHLPDRVILNVTAPMSGPFALLTTDTRLATITITGISNTGGTAGLEWLGQPYTLVLTYLDDDITASGDYVDPDNPPLPITLASFTASVVRDNDVEVAWKTVSETNNYGFEIYRKRGETGEWNKITFVEGHGTTLTPQSYSHVDREVTFGKYSYQIKQIDLDGKSKAFPEANVTVGIEPGKFTLAQNYPNPFNPSTMIEFAVPQSGRATLKVYNLLGQEVKTLFDGDAETGRIYTALFDASDVASGVYFYTLRSGGKVDTKRMVLMR